MENDILRVRRADGGTDGPGELVTMKSGAVWFHPYSGRAPILKRPGSLMELARNTGRLVIVKG
jgi:hypothetical protein